MDYLVTWKIDTQVGCAAPVLGWAECLQADRPKEKSMFRVFDPRDSESPFVVCDYHKVDLERADTDGTLVVEPVDDGSCVMCEQGE